MKREIGEREQTVAEIELLGLLVFGIDKEPDYSGLFGNEERAVDSLRQQQRTVYLP